MFCTNCGANLADDTIFCNQCGAKVANEQQQATINMGAVPNSASQGGYNATPTYGGPQYQYPQNPVNNKKIIMITAIAIASIIFLIGFISIVKAIATPGYSKPIKYMVKGMQNGDFKTMMKAFPEFMQDQMEEQIEYYSDDVDEYMEDFVNELRDQYGDHFKVSYKILDHKKLKSSKIKDLEEDIEYYYDEEMDIDEGYELEVELIIKGDEDEDSDETTFTVFKSGSKWYTMDSILN